jgi:hypothetical protein
VFWTAIPPDLQYLDVLAFEVSAAAFAVALALATLFDAALVPAYRAGRRGPVVAFVAGALALGLALSFWMSPFALVVAPVAIVLANRTREVEFQTGQPRDRLSQLGFRFGVLALLVVLGWFVLLLVAIVAIAAS